MQRLTRCTVILFLLAFLGTWSAPRLAAQTSTVRCESNGRSPQQCPIPANAEVELARTLSQEACRQGHNWDVAANFVWVSGGCRADFTVTSIGYGSGAGNASANPNQLRACRSEADRRMPAYSYSQISVEPESRQGSVAYVRWHAGTATGLCAVHANGRVIQFTTDTGGGGWNGGGTTTKVVCESQRTEREECRIPSGARIRLLRQTSQNPCRLNDTYGKGADYIWVAEGCRGEFEVVTGGGGAGRVVCASAVNTRRQCAIPPGAQVRLVRQMSEVQCRSSQNWGVGPDYVWVTRGCAGEFEVTRGEGGWQGGNGGGAGTRRIVCEAPSAARVQCRVAGATAVRLVKQYSTHPCRLNQSFGIGYGHMWVSSGCRGEFELVTGGNPADGVGGGGTGLPDRVVCESQGGERTECRIRAGGQARLVRQLSTTPCALNNTWGSGYGVIWVTRGCRGEFEVR
jgi:DUF3011 family protein